MASTRPTPSEEDAEVAMPDVKPEELLEPTDSLEVDTEDASELNEVEPSAGLFDMVEGVRELAQLRIERGRFETDQLAWYKVTFEEAFSDTPLVLAQVDHRDGWFEEQELGPVTLDSREVANSTAGASVDLAEKHLFVDFPTGFGALEDPINSLLEATAFWTGWGTGRVWAFVWNTISPMIASQVSTSLNFSPALLYAGSDRPRMKLTTAEVRRYRRDHFSMLGYPGADVRYLAIGTR